MRRFDKPPTLEFSLDAFQRLLDENMELREENRRLKLRVEELETLVKGDGRVKPAPPWVKPNAKKDPEEPEKKAGAKKGHEAHHRPSPSTEDGTETVDITIGLHHCDCGEEFGDPFDHTDRWIDQVIPGHVRRLHYRVAHYRCGKCGKLSAAKVPARKAPPRSRFCWGTHFLVAGWHAIGLTTSRIQMLLESDYSQKLSIGAIDKMLTRSTEFFAPAVEAIEKATREGKEVVVDNTGWRVDGVNHFLWDFISPKLKAALFVVDKSGGHDVPERVLPGNPEQTVVADGGKCFNPLKGKKRIQRDWVHIRRHAKDGLKGYETVSDAPDWRWLKAMKAAADAVLKAAKLPRGKTRDRAAAKVRARVERLLRREVEGEPARKLKKYMVGREEELWTWIETGGLAQSNAAEQGLRFHIAGKRKVSGGSRSEDGADRTAVLASIQATAKMRGINFREVGERLLHGDPDPLRMREGTPEPPVP